MIRHKLKSLKDLYVFQKTTQGIQSFKLSPVSIPHFRRMEEEKIFSPFSCQIIWPKKISGDRVAPQLLKNILLYVWEFIKYTWRDINFIKVWLLPSKKVGFMCFNESPLKNMKNIFYFTLEAFSVIKIFKFLFRFFWSCRKTAW